MAEENYYPPIPVEEDAEALANRLKGLSNVLELEFDTDWEYPRLRARLGTTEIPERVKEFLYASEYNAELVDANVKTPDQSLPHLEITVEIKPRWSSSGTRRLRENGGSVVFTVPEEALLYSGLRVGKSHAIESRDGEIRVTKP